MSPLLSLLISCAPSVAPRADAGDPRVAPLGAVVPLDGSYSEGDGLTYTWRVLSDSATIAPPDSPFATFTAVEVGHYDLTLEVCDEAGRCDEAEVWVRVAPPGDTRRISDWSPATFAGTERGAGTLDPLGLSKALCEQCFATASKTSSEWEAFCRTLEKSGGTKEQLAQCWGVSHKTTNERQGICRAYGCRS
jgi:hypothetical protein